MSKKCAILIVEDDDYTRESLCDLLEAEGYDVTSCDNGSTALDSAREKCFAAIITDYELPGLNGAEIVRSLRHQCPSSFIVGVSAGGKEAQDNFHISGTDVFLEKPYSFEELINLLRQKVHR